MARDGEFVLPPQVTGPADIGRLRREVEAVNDFLRQASLRKEDKPAHLKLPQTSRLLDELTTLNKLNLLHADDREALLAFLEQVRAHSPVLHISFAVDPSAAFTNKLVNWLRHNIHPQVLVQIGLQPSIAAGCVLRTPNHYYDFSLRRHFTEHRGVLKEKLEAIAANE